MLKFLLFILKITAFTAAVLVASHLVHWRGKTVSDQIKTHVARAEKAWSDKDDMDTDRILHSERQKLRALIRDLNRSERTR